MRVLIACESSGAVRRAFRALGHEAWSCDLLPAKDCSDYHLRDDALRVLGSANAFIGQGGARCLSQWDLVIAHPPCTRMALSGALRLYVGGKKKNGRDPAKWAELDRATDFFCSFFETFKGPICAENPLMHGHALERILSRLGNQVFRQIVQPYEFGDDASKATVLWLRGLPPLRKNCLFPPRHVCPKCGNTTRGEESEAWRDPQGKVRCHQCLDTPAKLARWSNQTDSGQNKLAPSPTRAAARAVTYEGIAKAMAEQWGKRPNL